MRLQGYKKLKLTFVGILRRFGLCWTLNVWYSMQGKKINISMLNNCLNIVFTAKNSINICGK
jgi:hypothetical protein